jgi:hypothetical protein
LLKQIAFSQPVFDRNVCNEGPLPIGIDTPTNLPFCNAGPVLGTKLPSRTPMIMARRIQSASRRSSQPRALKADDCSLSDDESGACFSTSMLESALIVDLFVICTGLGDVVPAAAMLLRGWSNSSEGSKVKSHSLRTFEVGLYTCKRTKASTVATSTPYHTRYSILERHVTAAR